MSDMGRGTAVWVLACAAFFGVVAVSTCVQEAGKGNASGVIGAILFTPILFYFVVRIGALAYNVLFVANEVLDAQITHGKEIRGEDD